MNTTNEFGIPHLYYYIAEFGQKFGRMMEEGRPVEAKVRLLDYYFHLTFADYLEIEGMLRTVRDWGNGVILDDEAETIISELMGDDGQILAEDIGKLWGIGLEKDVESFYIETLNRSPIFSSMEEEFFPKSLRKDTMQESGGDKTDV